MKNFIFFVLSIVSSLMAFSQGNTGGPPPVLFTTPNNASYFENLITENNNFGRVVYLNDRNSKEIKEIYLFDDSEGFVTVYTKDDKGYKVPNANYNLNSQQLEVLLENQKVFVFDLSTVLYFEKNNHKYVLMSHSDLSSSLFEVLVENDNATLLKGFEMISKEAMTNPLTKQVTTPAHVEKKVLYFLKTQNNFIELSQNPRKFLKLLPSHSEKIKVYIKENNLSIDNDNNLKLIINYYNTL